MALHGINLPLAFAGQEAIWQKVFQVVKYLGFSLLKWQKHDLPSGTSS